MKRQFFGKLLWLLYFFAASAASPAKPNDAETRNLEKKFSEMRSYLNESIDPCENFYEFTCGNWSNIFSADDDPNMETNFLLFIKKAFDKKATVILKDTANSDETNIDTKVKNFYKSCIKLKNGTTRESLVNVISEFGEMPVLNEENWSEENFDWIETLAKIKHQNGLQIIIGLDIIGDMRDNSKNRVYVGEAKFDLESKSIYLEDVGAMYRMMYRFSVELKLRKWLNLTVAQAHTTANEIVDFEISIARGMLENKSDKKVNSLLFNTTAEEMHEKYAPTIDVKKFLNITLGEVLNEMIYEYVPEYMVNLKNVIEKTEKRIIANYIFYHLIKEYGLDASETEEELEKKCLGKTKEEFAKNIDNMVYRTFDNKAVEADLSRIWKDLKTQFKMKLQSKTALDWLSDETRQEAIEKLDNLTLQINSYVDWDFKKEFGELDTNDDDYVGNLKSIMILDTKRYFEKLHGPLSPIDAGETLSVTPANVLVENTVKIPVAFLQPYYVWAPDFPDSLKFGITGFLLAHELIHAFDETGRQFGKLGNLVDWWDDKSEKEYNERKTCFKDQYQNYVYGDRKLPRSDLQAENIADNSGLKLAYDTYINARKSSPETEIDREMFGMKYTSEQIFIIGFGQFWCSDISSILLNLQTEVDEHTPGRFRTIGTVSNLEEFAVAFKCKIGSEMNPKEKCKMY